MQLSVRTLRSKQIGPIQTTEKSYSPDTTLALHEHEFAYVSFLLAGAYAEVCQQEERFCPSGTVIWHPKSEAHADRFCSGGGHLLDLEIDSAWLDDGAQELKLISGARMFCGGLPYSLGLCMYRELSVETYMAEDIAIDLLGFFFNGPFERHRPNWFNLALQVCSEVDDHKLCLGSLARIVGVHPVHVARSFRRFLGCTFGDYLAKLRIREAFELLRNSKRPIVDVAYTCGFADQAHLCRTFKKSTGLTPSQFRRSVQPNPQMPR